MISDSPHNGNARSVRVLLILAISAFFFTAAASAQDRAAIIEAAREIMSSVRYCGLVTLDASGTPRVRTMDAFSPEEGMVVWMGTNAATRKVQQIRENPRVTLYYADGDNGYVTIIGTATIVKDADEKARRWKEEWEPFYENRETDYLLLSVRPEKMEVVSYRHGLTASTADWAAPAVTFE